MYYKIIDKTSKQYKKLHKLRTKELKMEKDNLKALNERLGFEWDKFIGYPGQQNFNRVPIYMGFKPKSMEEIDFTIWRKDKEHPDYIVPNRKTKADRNIAGFLLFSIKAKDFKRIKSEMTNLQILLFFPLALVGAVRYMVIIKRKKYEI